MLENKQLASSLLFVIYFVPSCLVFQKIRQNHSHQIPISNKGVLQTLFHQNMGNRCVIQIINFTEVLVATVLIKALGTDPGFQ